MENKYVYYHLSTGVICAECGYMMEPHPIMEEGKFVARVACPHRGCPQFGKIFRVIPIRAVVEEDAASNRGQEPAGGN